MSLSSTEALELSVCVAGNTDYAKQAAADFARKYDQRVNVIGMPWETAWQSLVKVALYKTGADVSALGTTWIGSFVDVNVLRPFSTAEIASLGGEEAYFPATWQSSQLISSPEVWSIPYGQDVRVIFYWRDMLERAGIDEANAFQTAEQVNETCRRLQTSGVPTPWAVSTTDSTLNTLYYAWSWVWGKGGDFISADGKCTTFNSSQARAGLRTYYDLYRYMPHAPAPGNEYAVIDLFFARQVAAIIAGPWILDQPAYHTLSPDGLSRLGAALPPGPSFVGGTHLVIWAHIRPRLVALAIDLIRYLNTAEIQGGLAQKFGALPTRREALRQPPFVTDPRLQVFVKALETGRTHTRIPLWGLVEDKLTLALAAIWTDIKREPQRDLDALIGKHLEPLGERLDMLLAR